MKTYLACSTILLDPKCSLIFVVAIILLFASIITAIKKNYGASWVFLATSWLFIGFAEFQLVTYVYDEFSAPPGLYHSFPHFFWTLWAFRIHLTGLLLSMPTVLINGLQNQNRSMRIAAIIASAALALMSLMLCFGWKSVRLLI